MMRFVAILSCLISVLQAEVIAKPPPTARPTALERLQPLVGVWDIEATCWFTPDSEAFESKGIEHVYWSRNRQFLISDQWILLPAGWLPKTVITSWDPLKDELRLTNILPNATYVAIMKVGESMATTVEESKTGGHIIRTLTTSEQISPRRRRFRSECSIDDGPKWLFAEGISVKRGAVSKSTGRAEEE